MIVLFVIAHDVSFFITLNFRLVNFLRAKSGKVNKVDDG